MRRNTILVVDAASSEATLVAWPMLWLRIIGWTRQLSAYVVRISHAVCCLMHLPACDCFLRVPDATASDAPWPLAGCLDGLQAPVLRLVAAGPISLESAERSQASTFNNR